MADEKDVLLAMYNDECTHRRHHETQRSNVANLLLAISSALIGVMLVDGKLARPDHYLGIFMFLIAIFGILLTAKLYERFDLHRERAKKIRYRLDHLSPTLGLEAMRDDAEEKNKEKHKRVEKIHLHSLWSVFYGIVAGLAALLAIMAYVSLISGGGHLDRQLSFGSRFRSNDIRTWKDK